MHSTLPRRGLAVIVLLALAAVLPAADKPALPAKAAELIDVLFRAPDFELGKLSPDGAHFAYLHELKDHKVLDCYEFKTGKFFRLDPPRLDTTHYLPGVQETSTNISQDPISGAIIPAVPPPPPNPVYIAGVMQRIGNLYWTGPNQLVIQDEAASLDYSGLWVADATLQKCPKVNSGQKYLALLAALPTHPDFAILHEWSAKTLYTTLWQLNKESLTVHEFEGNPGKVFAWLLDQAGQVRVATANGSDGNTAYLHRPPGGKLWETIALPNLSVPVTFDASGQSVLVSLPGPDGRMQLQGFDLSKKQFSGAPIADPVYDLSPRVINDPKTGLPVGLASETAKPSFLWLNGQYAQIHATLQQSFPGATVQIHGVLESGEVLFAISSDVSPPVLYRYNPTKREVHAVLSALPEAAKRKWAPMQAVSFPARDGATLYGYLTLPLNAPAGKKIPLVALSHDGPAARDLWGFDPEVQFLAGLGYGVLQVNYRGSTGYGREHALKNSLEVCEKSVDDVADGIRWAIAQGHADPARIAAFGGGYGGYVSLGLATRYPDLLAASASVAGIYDWEGQSKYDGRSSVELLRMRQGFYLDPRANGDRFRPYSPTRAADQIRCPVLLFHGDRDATVEISQSNKLSRALRAAHKSVEVIKDAEGIHGLPNETARRTCYSNLAAFLLKNVPPDAL